MDGVVFEPGWEKHLAAPIAEMLESVSKEVLDDMKSLVPVRTGALQDDLDYEVGVEDGVPTARVGAKSLDYSVYVELGTSRMAAQPYITPAAYKNRRLEVK
jgi:HK97 gp10 family phage protein